MKPDVWVMNLEVDPTFMVYEHTSEVANYIYTILSYDETCIIEFRGLW